jgi:hypothetical protein
MARLGYGLGLFARSHVFAVAAAIANTAEGTISLADPGSVYVGEAVLLTAAVTGDIDTVDFFVGGVSIAMGVPVVGGVAITSWTPTSETPVDLRADGYASGHGLLATSTIEGVVPLITVTITTGTATFVVSVATLVSGTSAGLVGGTIQASFDPLFGTIVGTSGVIPAGGAWSLNATAVVGDVDDPATLYVREVGGTTARATLACTVRHAWLEDLVLDGVIAHQWDMVRGVTQAGTISLVEDTVAAEDIAQSNASLRPTYTASDADYGGGPSAANASGVHWLGGAGTDVLAQPWARLTLCKYTSGTGVMLDTGNATNRAYTYVPAGTWTVSAGTAVNTGVTADTTQPTMLLTTVAAGSTGTFVHRLKDGTRTIITGKNFGTKSAQGSTLLNNYNGSSSGSVATVALDAFFSTPPSAADLARIDTYLLQGRYAWSPLA